MRSALVVAMLVGGSVALAGTICPAGINYGHNPDPTATGCNVVITINANGSASTVVKDTTGYDGSDDTLIGVVNNSSTPVGSLNLTGTGIFGFDGDGICTYMFVGDTYCSASQVSGVDPGDYQGPTSTFVNYSSGNSGTVVFSPAIAPSGGSTYFSLEGVPSANLNITVSATPAPSTFLLLGIALALIAGWTFRSQIRNLVRSA